MPIPIHFSVTVADIVRHSPDVLTFWLTYERRRPQFRPGQFVHLALEEWNPTRHWPESRVFSIASAPSNTDGMRLTIARQGRFTSRILDTVREGQTLWCKGPYGDFVIGPRNGAGRIVLIAGGTGITPFCSFFEEVLLRRRGVNAPTCLYYGARNCALLAYRSLVDRCQSQVRGFRVRYFLEEVGEMPEVWPGRLELNRIVADSGPVVGSVFFLSGPKTMVDRFREDLIARHGATPDRVVVDAWG